MDDSTALEDSHRPSQRREVLHRIAVQNFIKKTEKTPTRDIDLALQRAKELKP